MCSSGGQLLGPKEEQSLQTLIMLAQLSPYTQASILRDLSYRYCLSIYDLGTENHLEPWLVYPRRKGTWV